MMKKTCFLMGLVFLAACLGVACDKKTPPAEETAVIEESPFPGQAPGLQDTATLKEVRKQYFQVRKATIETLKANADKRWATLDQEQGKARKVLRKEFVAQNPQAEIPFDYAAKSEFNKYIRELPKSNPDKAAYLEAKSRCEQYLKKKNANLKVLAARMKSLQEQQ